MGSAAYLKIRPFIAYNHSPQQPAFSLARSDEHCDFATCHSSLSQGQLLVLDVAETTTTDPHRQMTTPNVVSTDWLASKLRDRLQRRIAAGHPWKQLLQAASKGTLQEVSQTLQAYTLLWNPVATGKGAAGASSFLDSEATALELCGAAEQDLEKGLSFVREVEKGSHMHNDAVLRFRPEAIKTVCELCRDSITLLKQQSEHEEPQEEGGEGAGGAGALETAKELIGTVYRRVEPQVKTSFQVLVHRHKNMKRSR